MTKTLSCWPCGTQVMLKEGKDKAFKMIEEANLHTLLGAPSASSLYIPGTQTHFDYFMSQVSSEWESGDEVTRNHLRRKYKPFFNAQILKDSSMAWVIANNLAEQQQTEEGGGEEERGGKVLAVCGRGHVNYRFGIPERVQEIWEQRRKEKGTTTATTTKALHDVVITAELAGEEGERDRELEEEEGEGEIEASRREHEEEDDEDEEEEETMEVPEDMKKMADFVYFPLKEW